MGPRQRRAINREAKAQLHRDRVRARTQELRLRENHRRSLVDNIIRSLVG